MVWHTVSLCSFSKTNTFINVSEAFVINPHSASGGHFVPTPVAEAQISPWSWRSNEQKRPTYRGKRSESTECLGFFVQTKKNIANSFPFSKVIRLFFVFFPTRPSHHEDQFTNISIYLQKHINSSIPQSINVISTPRSTHQASHRYQHVNKLQTHQPTSTMPPTHQIKATHVQPTHQKSAQSTQHRNLDTSQQRHTYQTWVLCCDVSCSIKMCCVAVGGLIAVGLQISCCAGVSMIVFVSWAKKSHFSYR
jgi:hypothetical protein